MSFSFELCEKREQNQHSAISMVCRPLLCSQIQNTCINPFPEKKVNYLKSKTHESRIISLQLYIQKPRAMVKLHLPLNFVFKKQNYISVEI